MHPGGFEPSITVPKTVVISISPRVHYCHLIITYISLLSKLQSNKKNTIIRELKILKACGHGLVVEHVLAKDETGVRFSLAAQSIIFLWIQKI